MPLRPLLSALALAVLLAQGAAISQDKTAAVALQVVKYDGLKDAVLNNRGKVVLVDLWGLF